MARTGELASWANTDHLAIDYRFPYAVDGPEPYIGYLSLFDRYADSELGEFHAGQRPRFVADFGYDAENSYSQMKYDLGLNVDPLHHMQTVYGSMPRMFMLEHVYDGLARLSSWLPPTDFPVVRLIAPLHDIGENESPRMVELAGAVVGDIAHGQKTPQDKVAESKVRKVVLDEFYSDLPDAVLARMEPIASHTEDSSAHQMYVWAHEAETLETAYFAGDLVLKALKDGGPFDHRFHQLTRLAQEVGARTYRDLQEATTKFEYITGMLRSAEVFFHDLDTALTKGA